MLKRLSLKLKSSKKEKSSPQANPGAAVPYDPDSNRCRKESLVETWTAPSDVTSHVNNGVPATNISRQRDSEDGRLLAEAAARGDVTLLRQYIKDGCDVNSRDPYGNTPLHCAAHLGRSKVIRFLLLHGADIEAKTTHDRSSLDLAVEGGHTGAVGVLLDYMHSVDNRPRQPFILTRSRRSGSDTYLVERVSSSADLRPFKGRGLDQLYFFIAHSQKAADLSVFLYSTLDTPVCHAFFLNTTGEFNMKNFQRFETKSLSQSLTVLNTNIKAMETSGYESLRSLILVSCSLNKVPLDGLKSLELLDLCHNEIEFLPESIGNCSYLKSLRISHNKFKFLPKTIGQLDKLSILEASNNTLRTLPSYITKCQSLKVLHLNYNQLHHLPVDLGLLANLEELIVSNNKLAQLPLSLSALDKLELIEFHSNPLTNIPRDFPERAVEVKEYLKSLRDDPVPNKIVKLVLVGQEGVGKTTLLSALKRTLWLLPRNRTTVKTEGIKVKDIDLNDITYKCFDCGGDVDFNETHRFFITPGALILACFDLSEYAKSTVEKGSFLLGRLQLWLKYVFSKVPSARVIIVGTHADSSMLKKRDFEEIWELVRSLLVSGRDHHRQYFGSHDRVTDCLICQSDSKCLRRTSGEGDAGYVNLGCDSTDGDEDETSFNEDPSRVVAYPHIVGYYEVSSVKAVGNSSLFQFSTNQSIQQLKVAVLEVGRKLVAANPMIPNKWANVYESLQNFVQMNPDNCATNLAQVQKLALAQGVSEEQDLINMLHFLKAQGSLLFFPQSDDLSDVVILDPEWLAKIFATVVSYRDTGVGNDGFIEQKRLKLTWKSSGSSNLADKLLSLLHYFGVCLPIKDTGMELFPCKLPLGEPDEYVWPVCPDLYEKQITYSVTFPTIVPPPLFSELILTVYRQRVPVTCNEESSRYFANVIVENLKLIDIGCRDCQQGPRGPPAYLEDEDLVHKVLFELIPHKRTIQITLRGAQPCCMARTVSRILNQVVTKYEGLGKTELDTIICPGCFMQKSKQQHRFSAKALLAEASSRQGITCANGHTVLSAASILLGNLDDSCMPYLTIKAGSTEDRQDYSGCPKLFIMLPVNLDGLNFSSTSKMYTSSLLYDGFAVHLICEFPDGYHLTNAPGYRLKCPEDFFDSFGLHVIAVLRLLGHMAESSVVSLSSQTKAISKTVHELIHDLCSRYPDVIDTLAGDSPGVLLTKIHANGKRFSRQELRNYLHVMDRPDTFGPLRRLKLPDQTLWLCNDHYRQLRMLSVGLNDIQKLDESSKV